MRVKVKLAAHPNFHPETEYRYRRVSKRRWVWFARRDGRWELERPRERMELEERRRVAELLAEFNAEGESPDRGEGSQL